jgi:hypothetical protein
MPGTRLAGVYYLLISRVGESTHRWAIIGEKVGVAIDFKEPLAMGNYRYDCRNAPKGNDIICRLVCEDVPLVASPTAAEHIEDSVGPFLDALDPINRIGKLYRNGNAGDN